MGAMTLRLSIAMTPEMQANQDRYNIEQITEIIDKARRADRRPMTSADFAPLEGKHWGIKFYLGYLFSVGPQLIDVVVRIGGGNIYLCSPSFPDLALYPPDYDGGGLSKNLDGGGGYTLLLPRPKGSHFAKNFWIIFYPGKE